MEWTFQNFCNACCPRAAFTQKRSLHWLRESGAITSWPPIFLSDITVFLMEDRSGKDVDLHERVLNEYKEGKAYRLYESGWLKEIYWHPTSTASEFFFLKANCTHHENRRHTSHSLDRCWQEMWEDCLCLLHMCGWVSKLPWLVQCSSHDFRNIIKVQQLAFCLD